MCNNILAIYWNHAAFYSKHIRVQVCIILKPICFWVYCFLNLKKKHLNDQVNGLSIRTCSEKLYDSVWKIVWKYMYNYFDNSLLVLNSLLLSFLSLIITFFAQVSLKCKLASESSKAVDQRDMIQQLQNELIRVSNRPLLCISVWHYCNK